MSCTVCHREEREDEIHAWSPPGVHDASGRPIPPACYTDEGDAIDPIEDDAPTAEELSAVTPDPWLDPDAAAAAVPPPF